LIQDRNVNIGNSSTTSYLPTYSFQSLLLAELTGLTGSFPLVKYLESADGVPAEHVPTENGDAKAAEPARSRPVVLAEPAEPAVTAETRTEAADEERTAVRGPILVITAI
jgi:hypothetical protein